MDIREFLQAVVGAVVLQPDQLLMSSAQPDSAILQALGQRFGASGEFLNAFGLLHTFCLVAGIGLLMGLGASTSVFIGLLVVLGVAGGLYALASLLGVVGFNAEAVTGSITGAFGSAFAHPLVADGFVVLPFAVLALGVVRYRWGAGRRSRKVAEAAQGSMRQYCSYCGSVVKPGRRRCEVCRKGVPKASTLHCTNCGRFVPKDARYCWVCGDEMRLNGAGVCKSCGELVASEAKFCPHCGARQSHGPDSAEPAPHQP